MWIGCCAGGIIVGVIAIILRIVNFGERIECMETTIRINTDQLNLEIMEGIKKMFPHKTVEITIQPADATEYILNNEAYSKELQERIVEYEARKKVVVVKDDELL